LIQAKFAKKRQLLWDDLLHTLADDLVPLRPGRREPRLTIPQHEYHNKSTLSHFY
jgi:hypothetical protein